jgi:hypothetical protein
MAFAPFHCAFGDSPEVELQVATEVDISPPDDSVDTNRVRIAGAGTVESLGFACGGLAGEIDEPQTVTKRIAWVPSGAGILLKHNPPTLRLLGTADRTITTDAYGYYASDEDGNWQEESFTQADASPTLSGGALIALNTYAASAIITIPPGATRAWIRMWGGAGGSGAGDSQSGLFSGGTGAPGYLEKFATGLTPGRTLIYTRGNGGAAGAAGTAATLASGTQTIATLTANGSLGSATAGTDGGTATGGDINIKGQHGTPGMAGLGPSAGGATGLARGTDGSINGAAGLNGGLVIAWYNDAHM